MRKLLIGLLVLMSAVSLASADAATLSLDPLVQSIAIGTNGTYNLTLNTNVSGQLYWDTNNSKLSARLEAASFNQSGNINVSAGLHTYKLQVQPNSGITAGTQYDVSIWHTQGAGIVAKASATAGVVPVPEFSTIALTSAGILGLVMISRKNRKN
jgi:hypothetical protein